MSKDIRLFSQLHFSDEKLKVSKYVNGVAKSVEFELPLDQLVTGTSGKLLLATALDDYYTIDQIDAKVEILEEDIDSKIDETELTAALQKYVLLDTDQTITGSKVFSGNVTVDTLVVSTLNLTSLNISGATTFADVPTVNGDSLVTASALETSLGGYIKTSATINNKKISSSPVLTGEDIKVSSSNNSTLSSAISDLTTNKANDSAVVHIEGPETIKGVKTFSATPIITNRALKSAASGYEWTFPQKTGTVALTDDLSSYVKTSRTVNGKALSSNITLSAGDVGAYTKSESDAKYVTLSGNETITGTKTFSNAVITNLTTTTLDIQNLNISGATAFTTAPTVNGSSVVTTDGLSTILTGYQTKLTFDTAPNANSTNPVTSRGIQSALSAKQDSINVGKGILKTGTSTISLNYPAQYSGFNFVNNGNTVHVNVANRDDATKPSVNETTKVVFDNPGQLAVYNATTDKRGVAYLATSLDDTRADAVPTASQVKSTIESLGTVLNFMGFATSVADTVLVNSSGNSITASDSNKGDVYIIAGADGNSGVEYVSDGSTWQKLGYNTDLSGYATEEYVDKEIVNLHEQVDNIMYSTSAVDGTTGWAYQLGYSANTHKAIAATKNGAGLLISSDEGSTWNPIASGDYVGLYVGPTFALAGGYGGIPIANPPANPTKGIKKVDLTTGTVTTVPITINNDADAVSKSAVWCIAANDDETLFVAGMAGNEGLLYSTNLSTGFVRSEQQTGSIVSLTYHNGAFYAGMGNNAANIYGILKSTDGINWEQTGQTTAQWFSLISYKNKIFAGTTGNQGNGFICSADDGATWTKVERFGNNAAVYGVTIGPDGDLYALNRNGQVFKTSDGDTWHLAQTSDGFGKVYSMCSTSNKIIIGRESDGLLTFGCPAWSPITQAVTIYGEQTIAGSKTFTGDVTFGNISANTFTIDDLIINGSLSLTETPLVGNDKVALESAVTAISNNLSTNYYTKTAADNKFIDNTSNETVSGIKTFNSLPVSGTTSSPTLPTNNNQLTTKKYVDSRTPQTIKISNAAISANSSGEYVWTYTLSETPAVPPFVQVMDADGNIVYANINYKSGVITMKFAATTTIPANTYTALISGSGMVADSGYKTVVITDTELTNMIINGSLDANSIFYVI